MFYFYTPWKRHETFGFLTFSGGTEMEHGSCLSVFDHFVGLSLKRLIHRAELEKTWKVLFCGLHKFLVKLWFFYCYLSCHTCGS